MVTGDFGAGLQDLGLQRCSCILPLLCDCTNNSDLLMLYVEKSFLGDFALSSFSFRSNTILVWFGLYVSKFFLVQLAVSLFVSFLLLDLFLSSISLFGIDFCRYEGKC